MNSYLIRTFPQALGGITGLLRMKKLVFTILFTVVTFYSHAAIITTSLPVNGSTVDLSGLNTNVPISSTDSIFTSVGIASFNVDSRPSGNNELYDSGILAGGRALFNTELGELIALDKGDIIDFGSPTFTIDFIDDVTAFGFRLVDTSSSFVVPIVQLFRDGVLVDTFEILTSYDASTEFGFADALGFDRVVVSTVDSDGYGITDITVGSVATTTPVSSPSIGFLLLLSVLMCFFRKGNKS